MNYIILDCETANTIEDALVYDCGWAIVNSRFEVIETRSFIVADIFLDEKELMKSAYFAEKIPSYLEDVDKGTRIFKKFYNVRKQLLDDCRDYKVKAIIAHNSRFDYNALTTTQRFLTSSKYRRFFPRNVEIWDSLKMSRQTFAKDEQYISWCTNNNYLQKNGKPRLTAEILYRYISNDSDFEEKHTGLEDVLIEVEISKQCLRMNKDIDCRLFSD